MMRSVTQLSAAPPSSDFDRATSLEPDPDVPGDFTVVLDAGWSSLVGVHGGYMCALAVRGAELIAPDRSVRTLTTSFVRSGTVGPARLTVRQVRAGRSFTTVTADLSQDGRLLLTSRMTLMVARPGVEWSVPVAPALPPPADCVRMDGGRVLHFDRVDGRLDPASLPFTGSDRAVVRGYVRPLEGRAVDPAWLAMATDWFPPPAFVRLEPPTGGVSIDLTTHVHQPHVTLRPDEWLTGTFEILTSTGGLAVEHGLVALPDGTPVAESFQTRLTATD
jgi:acyl-CoA thioesterase